MDEKWTKVAVGYSSVNCKIEVKLLNAVFVLFGKDEVVFAGDFSRMASDGSLENVDYILLADMNKSTKEILNCVRNTKSLFELVEIADWIFCDEELGCPEKVKTRKLE